MKSSEGFRAHLIRWAFGIYGSLDERTEHELGRICINAVLLLNIFMVLGFVGVGFAEVMGWSNFVSDWILVIVLLCWGILGGVVQSEIRRSGIDRREMTQAAYKVLKRSVLERTALLALPVFCIFLVFWVVVERNFGEAFIGALLDWRYLVGALISTLFIDAYMVNLKLSSVRIVDEQE
jgi:hypothetical protein